MNGHWKVYDFIFNFNLHFLDSVFWVEFPNFLLPGSHVHGIYF